MIEWQPDPKLVERMRALGWTWDEGNGGDDGRFVKPEHLPLTVDAAAELVRGGQNPGNELRG